MPTFTSLQTFRKRVKIKKNPHKALKHKLKMKIHIIIIRLNSLFNKTATSHLFLKLLIRHLR